MTCWMFLSVGSGYSLFPFNILPVWSSLWHLLSLPSLARLWSSAVFYSVFFFTVFLSDPGQARLTGYISFYFSHRFAPSFLFGLYISACLDIANTTTPEGIFPFAFLKCHLPPRLCLCCSLDLCTLSRSLSTLIPFSILLFIPLPYLPLHVASLTHSPTASFVSVSFFCFSLSDSIIRPPRLSFKSLTGSPPAFLGYTYRLATLTVIKSFPLTLTPCWHARFGCDAGCQAANTLAHWWHSIRSY